MSEQQGQIHGLISREQMHDMWLPYGERLAVSAEVSDNPTPHELVMMYLGASEKASNYVWRKAVGMRAQMWPLPPPKDSQARTFRLLLDDPGDKIANRLLDDYGDQVEETHREMERTQESGAEYLQLFSRALGNIARIGIITDEQAELMSSRLYDGSGNPFMQEAPMTMVQLGRHHSLTHPGGMPDQNMGDSTDLCFGMILNPVRPRELHNKKIQESLASNRAHEWLHSIQGLEIYDITLDNGLRLPDAVATGHYLTAPSTEVSDEMGYGQVENTELAEGFTEYLTMLMHLSTPELGPYDPHAETGYGSFRGKMAEIYDKHLELFRTVVNASLLEDSNSPDAKKDALDRMHDHGELVLGAGGITAWMQADRSFSDCYSNDNRPDVIAASAMS